MKLRKNEVLDNFISMIRLKTVSTVSGGEEEEAVFGEFRRLLKERYPLVFGRAEVRLIGRRGLLLRIPGRKDGDPTVLMAHYDVVPADGRGWCSDPFGAEIRGGRVIGRGTLDTKSTLCAILEAVTYCLENGIVPLHDLYLSFGGEEEISGSCCSEIVDELASRKIRPFLVLDEGGTVVPEGVPGIKKQAAMIGIAEKGTANYRIVIGNGSGGHAAAPPRHTLAGRLAACAVEIESHPFPTRISGPVRKMFRELADEAPLYVRPLFAHPEQAAPLIRAAAPVLGSTFNAMVRTTTAVTVMNSGTALNMLPDRAEMAVNVRLLEGDTTETAAAHLRSVISDPDAEISLIAGTDPTPVSETDCDAWRLLKRVIASTWKDTVIAPYQMNGGTDARFYSRISDHVYRFSPMVMTSKERATVHGINESIAISSLMTAVAFYIRLITELSIFDTGAPRTIPLRES